MQVAPQRRSDLDPVALATLAAVIVILMLTFSTMRDLDRLERSLGERLAKLETQVSQVATRPSAVAAAPPQQGPDPNRIYTVNMVGAPTKGRAEAPVTIVEFSEFQ